MTAVLVEITARLFESDSVEFVPDLEALSESNRCSCSVGDDQPY